MMITASEVQPVTGIELKNLSMTILTASAIPASEINAPPMLTYLRGLVPDVNASFQKCFNKLLYE